jgi:putative CocE/NonD family hydrolase
MPALQHDRHSFDGSFEFMQSIRRLLRVSLCFALTLSVAGQTFAQGRNAAAQAAAAGAGQGGAGAGAAAAAGDSTLAYVKENYTKYEYMIPMRDGVRLFTTVYVPKDDEKKYPILLTRTPYTVRPYGEDVYGNGGAMGNYAKEKFIFALQDVRGKNGSEGTFVHMRPIIDDKKSKNDIDESSDCYDTIDWLIKKIPNNNGKVGLMGISYPGFYSACGMIDSHPALKCVSPQAPISDWFIGDDMHHNGTFFLAAAFNFFSWFGQKLDDPLHEQAKRFDFRTPDGYDFFLNMGPLANADKKYLHGKIEFWNDMMEHPNDDEFWRSRNLRPHLKNVHAAVMTVGGWYDAEDLFGALNIYKDTEKLNPGAFNILVMGPWSHGQWSRGDGEKLGNVEYFSKTSQYYRDNIELPFLKHFLKDEEDEAGEGKKGAKKFKLAEAIVYENGTNQWRRYDSWPPKNVEEKTLYLHANGKLNFEKPQANEDAAGFDEYVSDPAKPVPYSAATATLQTREYMTDDQRFAASRTDVLTYQTAVLEEDITLAGPISAALHVSSTGTDSDFVVKLIDVYSNEFPNALPNPGEVQMGGYQQLVRGEPMRAKFRNSYENPEALVPGQTTAVNLTLPDVYHTFRRGHRIMIQVQSSWFPLVDRNPQKFCDIYRAAPEDFQKATQHVYRTPQTPSLVKVQVMPQATATKE